VTAALYGLLGPIGGGVLLAVSEKERQRVELVPSNLDIALDFPRLGVRKARLTTTRSRERFSRIAPIRYRASLDQWEAPLLRKGLSLKAQGTSGISKGRLARIEAFVDKTTRRLTGQPAAPSGGGAPIHPKSTTPAAPLPPAIAAAHEQARTLKRAGRLCYRKRDYRCALQKFSQAYRLHPTPALVFNVASARDKLGQPVAAVKAYLRYLQDAPSATTSVLSFIRTRLADLFGKVGRLRLAIRPAGHRVRVKVDGKPQSLPATAELVVSPGRHSVFVSDGARQITQEVTIGAGKKLALRFDFAP
jgi:tetratricopeptide (TPR) repeat protein